MTLKIGNKNVTKIAIGDNVYRQSLVGTTGYLKSTQTAMVGGGDGESYEANLLYLYTISGNNIERSDSGVYFTGNDSNFTVLGEIIAKPADKLYHLVLVTAEAKIHGSTSQYIYGWLDASELFGGVNSLPARYISIVCVTYVKEVA